MKYIMPDWLHFSPFSALLLKLPKNLLHFRMLLSGKNVIFREKSEIFWVKMTVLGKETLLRQKLNFSRKKLLFAQNSTCRIAKYIQTEVASSVTLTVQVIQLMC